MEPDYTEPAQAPTANATPTSPLGINSTQPQGSPNYGPLYQPSYDPENSGWDSILKNIQENADATAKTTGDTLSKALGVEGITIDKNKGVLGLPTAQKAARAYQEAGIPVHSLQQGAFSSYTPC